MYLQDGDEEGIPELLSADGVATLSGEGAIGLDTVVQADKDPDEDDRQPSCEAVVALEEAGGGSVCERLAVIGCTHLWW